MNKYIFRGTSLILLDSLLSQNCKVSFIFLYPQICHAQQGMGVLLLKYFDGTKINL